MSIDIMSIKITLIIAHLESQIMFIVLIYSFTVVAEKTKLGLLSQLNHTPSN